MTLITFQDGKPVMKEDGTIGTEQACCCVEESCIFGACCGPDTFLNGPAFEGERLVCRDISAFTLLTVQQCLDEGGVYYDCKFCSASSDFGALGCLECGPWNSALVCEDPP